MRSSVIYHLHLANRKRGRKIKKGKGPAQWIFSSSEKNLLNHSPRGWSWWLMVVVFILFIFSFLFGTEGFGVGLGEPGSAPQGVFLSFSYNPVAPKGIPELWLMQGIDCMDLGNSWLTTRPFSPLPPLLAPAPLFRGSVDVLMASLMDCCGIKQKPFIRLDSLRDL